MKTLIWDVECTDLELSVRTYQLKNYTKYFKPDTIVRDWTLLSIAWKWLDDKNTEVIAVDHKDPLNDEYIVREFHKVLNQADVLIGHNMKRFDYKKFNTRAICYDLPPISPPLIIDTLAAAKSNFSMTSNELDYLAKKLKVPVKKMDAPDWDKVLNGDKKEINYMKRYNKADVVVSELVYKKMRPWITNHPNIFPIVRDIKGNPVFVCRKCASSNLAKSKDRHYPSGRSRRQWQCKDCFSYTTTDLIR